MTELIIGKKVPDFKLSDQDGKEHKLSDYKGKKVIIYFYPKDDTPGCTTEACNFRDDSTLYKKKGAVVLGISTDDVKSHKKFSEKYSLPFTLLSDTEKKVVDAFGVWKKKKFMGREYMGISRETFVIDENMKLIKHFDEVDVKIHSKEILELL